MQSSSGDSAMDSLEWILAGSASLQLPKLFSPQGASKGKALHTTGTPQIPDMVDGKAAENYRFTHNTDWHKEQTKSFVDVAVLVSHVTQFSFPKANVLIAN